MTFTKLRITIIALIAVTAGCVLGVGIYAVLRMNRSKQCAALFKEHINAYLATTAERPELGVYVKGKAVVVDLREKAVDDDVFFALPSTLRATGPDEVGTVVLLKWGVEFVGHFENKQGRDLGSASVANCEVTVIDASIPAILDRRTFASKAIVRGIDGGARPFAEIVDYLVKLPQEAAKESPAPKGWFVLFRSDDASVWNKDSPGDKFALPIRRSHSGVRYLRLKRIDTGDFLILPITSKQLTSNDKRHRATETGGTELAITGGGGPSSWYLPSSSDSRGGEGQDRHFGVGNGLRFRAQTLRRRQAILLLARPRDSENSLRNRRDVGCAHRRRTLSAGGARRQGRAGSGGMDGSLPLQRSIGTRSEVARCLRCHCIALIARFATCV